MADKVDPCFESPGALMGRILWPGPQWQQHLANNVNSVDDTKFIPCSYFRPSFSEMSLSKNRKSDVV